MARAGANFKAYFLFAALILRQDEGGVDASALITSGDLRGSHSHLSALMRIGGLADCTKGRTLEFRNFLKIRTNFAKIGTDKNPKISVFGIYPFAGLSGVLPTMTDNDLTMTCTIVDIEQVGNTLCSPV
jgi:hypothetical protein